MQQFGLIGRSLNYSFSKEYFTNKFNSLSINANYQNFECESISDVEELLNNCQAFGLNVTMPYKEVIIPLLDFVDPIAIEVGAVNTVVRVDGKWNGYNTDVFGFKQMIKPFFESHHERAIILGTGGASKAVQYVLEELGCNTIFISRNPTKQNEFGYEDINEVMLNSCPIIVNTTPVGTFPNSHEIVQVPYQHLSNRQLVIDLVYNPIETRFLKHAKEQGATTINGLTMLHQQAEKAWEIWQSN
ncbi:MAG: shikimate dehydrogenase [Crocinitomicaceae bacterium]